MAHFQEGRYLVRIQHQRFLESQQRGTLGFSLTFLVQKNLDEPPRSRPQSRWDGPPNSGKPCSVPRRARCGPTSTYAMGLAPKA
jgi:hypothetical protein